MGPSVFDEIQKVILTLTWCADIRQVFFSASSQGKIKESIMFETDIIPHLVNKGTIFLYKCNAFWSQVKTAGLVS